MDGLDPRLKLKEGRRTPRERVKSGTRPHPTDFSAPASGRLKSSGTVFSLGELFHVGYAESSRTLSRPRGGVSPPSHKYPLKPNAKPLFALGARLHVAG